MERVVLNALANSCGPAAWYLRLRRSRFAFQQLTSYLVAQGSQSMGEFLQAKF
jgi:hypothetical protein